MTGKTLGGYIRTTPDPDDMDGGVTAALIEQEAERPTADDFANAEFARHPDGRTACSKLPHSGLPWIDSKGERWGSGAFARDGWSQVRECPDPAVHTQVGIVRAVAAATPCSCSAQRGRAERAEKERDKALQLADRFRDHAKASSDSADRLKQERDEARDERYAAEREREELRHLNGIVVREKDEWEANEREQAHRAEKAEAESVRLAAILDTTARQRDEADMRAARAVEVTDEMVERGLAAWKDEVGRTAGNYGGAMFMALTAALTPEPQRPEGLTALIDTIREATYDPEPVATGEALYNAGVRVVGEERS